MVARFKRFGAVEGEPVEHLELLDVSRRLSGLEFIAHEHLSCETHVVDPLRATQLYLKLAKTVKEKDNLSPTASTTDQYEKTPF